MQTMDAALAQLVRAGKVNRQLAESRAHAPEEFRRLLSAAPQRRLSGGRVAMATYVFKAMDLAGVQAKGEVEADSKQAVAEQLKERGLVVVDIAHKYRSKELNIELFSRVNAKDLAVASRQLATMVTSGMTIMRALHVLETQTGSKMLRETIAAVRHDVEAGLLLSDAMARHPKVFGPLYVAMVKAGETGGVLEECLMRVADQLEKDAALRRQVRAAMIYPAVTITFAIAVLMALVAFLIPVFVGVFKQFPGKLPALTQFMVNFSHLVTHQWYLLIVVGRCRRGRASSRSSAPRSGRDKWDAFKLRVPMKIGEVVQKVAIARWSRTLSALASAGVPIMQAIEITGKTAGNAVIEKSMDDVITSVKGGGTISAPLRQCSAFPPMVSQMIGVGEETGALDTMLEKIADFYDSEVEAAVKALTSILEPVDDHLRRRHRRRDRDLDVPAAVQHLQQHQVALAARPFGVPCAGRACRGRRWSGARAAERTPRPPLPAGPVDGVLPLSSPTMSATPDEVGAGARRAAGPGSWSRAWAGTPHEVTCPWCGGTGEFQAGRDAQQEGPEDAGRRVPPADHS